MGIHLKTFLIFTLLIFTLLVLHICLSSPYKPSLLQHHNMLACAFHSLDWATSTLLILPWQATFSRPRISPAFCSTPLNAQSSQEEDSAPVNTSRGPVCKDPWAASESAPGIVPQCWARFHDRRLHRGKDVLWYNLRDTHQRLHTPGQNKAL